MLITKDQRTRIVDLLEGLCETSNLSKKTLGYTMRSYHVATPLILMAFLLYSPQWVVTIHALNLMIALVCFYIFGGCLLTMLEHRLCGDDYTIADTFIEQMGMELNGKNRVRISYGMAIGYLIFFFIVYYFRFYYKRGGKKIINKVVEKMMPNTLLSDVIEMTTL